MKHLSRIVLLSAVLIALILAWLLYEALFPVFLGFALAYAFSPLADWLERKGLSRTLAVGLIMGALSGAVLLATALLIPPLASEAADFARSFPDYFARAVERATRFAESWGIPLPHRREEILLRLRGWLSGFSLTALSPVGRFAARFFSGAGGLVVGALNLVVVPVVFFYLLHDLSRIRRSIVDHVPVKLRGGFEAHLAEADRVFSGYLRGQMLVALILAVLYSLGLSLLGIRFGIVIGLTAGIMNFIPYLGVLTGLVLSLTMAAVDFSGWGTLVGVLAVFGACQLLEGFFITPRIVGDKVGLTPLETIVALILGGEWGGFSGLILAIPAAGCLKAYGKDLLAAYRRSAWYRS
ncbi:MAG: AI-2E family transporter [Elusimicrobiota bacterium]